MSAIRLLIQTAGLKSSMRSRCGRSGIAFPLVGPKRVNDPGIAFADLPPIDVVLVSHGHYDHLDVRDAVPRIAAAHRHASSRRSAMTHHAKITSPAIKAEAHDWDMRVDLGAELR